jgi:hypothetical protein
MSYLQKLTLRKKYILFPYDSTMLVFRRLQLIALYELPECTTSRRVTLLLLHLLSVLSLGHAVIRYIMLYSERLLLTSERLNGFKKSCLNASTSMCCCSSKR